MSLTALLPPLRQDPAIASALDFAASTPTPQRLDITAPGGVRAPLVAMLAEHAPLLVITPTGRQAEELATELACYRGHAEDVALFPSWETLPHERLSPRSDTVGRRVSVLRRLVHPDAATNGAGPLRIVLAPVRAVLQPLVTGLADLTPVQLGVGDEADLEHVAVELADAGYARVDMVERRGEFAVRGGILDVFPPDTDHPVRVEFFGDDVEEVRYFSVADQRSLPGEQVTLWAPPVREVLLTPQVRARAAQLQKVLPGVTDMLERIAAGVVVEGMESLAPALVDGMQPLLELLPADMRVVVAEPDRVKARAHDLVATTEEFRAAAWSNATAGNVVPIDIDKASFVSYDECAELAQKLGTPWWSIGSLRDITEQLPEEGEHSAPSGLVVSAAPLGSYRGRFEAAISDLRQWAKAGGQVVLTCAGRGSAQRLAEQLGDEGLPVRAVGDLAEPPEHGLITIATATLAQGFHASSIGLTLITESDLMGRAANMSAKSGAKMPSRRKAQVDPLQLKAGDYVVHEQHGVGRFIEMVQRQMGGATREYLVIEYAASRRGQPADRLFVPTDSLDQISRYIGGEQPTVHKLGGSDWVKTKDRARKAVREIAGELLRLYGARMASKGHAFGPDTVWQRELEDAFAYVETPDQLSTIDEVKADMEKPIPMDRLICGDVGYGKTEIAVRAAFKAVQDGKQVAVLVPTTLLVSQHFDTFTHRVAAFPVRVRALSRFQNASESDQVLKGLADGTIDIVIGTHRLLGSNVAFKDLGLVIVDEEQRFGVEHKEALKRLRTNVDVLAMSATPIPRTLEMAVTGIREMSTLATPPEERHPVLTYVGEYDEKTVTAAIRRELLREGQVFYVHNRVESIDRAAGRLRELIPEARVAVAHGKMNEHRLEEVIQGFWEKDFDVLVCTTIVETGLDISNANTLILERADRLGLSQLHQLRGRVGRGRERAYAYFLYPPETPLSDTSHDRLATIAQHTDLGAGMQVAMKDLEIRGAGNLLGGEQSGHIAGVGFDLYVRMVGEAVQEFKGDVPVDLSEVKLELPIDAHLPHSYVPHERLRLEAYRKLSAATSEADVDAVTAELADRYGQPEEPVRNLLAQARLRVLARNAGIHEITAQGNRIKFGPVQLRESQQMRLKRLYPGALYKDATSSFTVAKPTEGRIGGKPLRDQAIIDWAGHLIRSVVMQ